MRQQETCLHWYITAGGGFSGWVEEKYFCPGTGKVGGWGDIPVGGESTQTRKEAHDQLFTYTNTGLPALPTLQ